jgi:hypothetical protein
MERGGCRMKPKTVRAISITLAVVLTISLLYSLVYNIV